MKRPILTFALLSILASSAMAQTTDIASSPLAQSVSDNVKPNLMFILDDSGSMASRYMPDYINDNNIDKSRCSNSSCTSTTTVGREGNPPWYAYQFNGLYYDPKVTYVPAVNADGTSMASYGSPWTSVRRDAFVPSAGTIDLANGYPEVVYCLNNNDDPIGNASNCRRNGIDSGNPFLYDSATTNGFPNGTGSGAYRFPIVRNGHPFYYELLAREHCADETLTNCTLSDTPNTSFPVPAPVRYCQTAANAASTTAVAGTATNNLPHCQDKYASTHTRPRYGRFNRVDIVPSTATYSGRPDRSDCVARPVCTYAEEMTNFANWYAYYSTRLQMMKSGAGRAFTTIDNRFRVGFITINPGNPVASSRYTRVDSFEGSHKSGWYSQLYNATTNGVTPLREALSRVGRHFAGKTDGINRGMNDDPVQYSCQRNVALLTTDGYWNSNAGVQVDGSTAIGNQDNVDGGYSKRADDSYGGKYDGNLARSTNTLADVAMYYYKSDLRPAGATGAFGTDVSKDTVPTSKRYENPEQHMITFTLGLGLDGRMRYRPDYETAASGDFKKIRDGNNSCPWASGVCNWPELPSNPEDTGNVDPSKIDDLWHAAVNGRGKYISAGDANGLVQGLIDALNEMKVQEGAAAGSATSSANITPTDNYIFGSSYRTNKWDGELTAQQLDPVTAEIMPGIAWSARERLNAMVSAAGDSRTVYTNVGGALVPFRYDDLDSTAKAFFDNRCASLSQCASLDATERTIGDSGSHLINFVRGQRQHEAGVFREREFVLADIAGSRPEFVREPYKKFGDAVLPTYMDFKTAQAGRGGTVYVGSNGGMLHAFNADDGNERWSFVPRAMLPNLYRLADQNYRNAHRYFVDGSPSQQDVYYDDAWHTVLVGGYNAGGRGFYALDITNPGSPSLLWEICSDSTLCSISEPNLGLSFGKPVITKRAYDGRWVVLVTSGYNNVSPGDGKGHLFVLDVKTGAVLDRVTTGVGSTTAPSGLARIADWVRVPHVDNTALYVYGGDLQGNLWRFDMSTSPPSASLMATLRDGANRPQPVTTQPELGRIDGKRVVFVGTGRLLGVSDLQDPSTLSHAGNWSYQGTMYALRDDGSALNNPRAGGQIVAQTISTLDAVRRTITRNAVDWSKQVGWYIDLPSSGERVNVDPQLALGTLQFVGNIPSTDACTAGGSSWLYQVDYATGAPVPTSTDGAAGWLNNASLIAGNVIVQNGSLALKNVATLTNNRRQTGDVNVRPSSTTPRRIGWREVVR